MEKIFVDVADLFESLGLPSDANNRAAFIDQHTPLDNTIRIEDAPFWTKSQSSLLRDALQEDGHLANAADQLNTSVRH